LNPNSFGYKLYGGRGIKICDDWLDKETGFISFRDWALLNGYRDELTLDRIDVNGDYEPSNCRWATRAEQTRNRRLSIFVMWEGEKRLAVDIAKEIGMGVYTFYGRLSRGLSPFEALTIKVGEILLTQEKRQRMSEAQKRRFSTPEGKRQLMFATQKAAESVRGKPKSAEIRAKLAEAGRKRMAAVSDDYRKKVSDGVKRYFQSEEARQKQSEAQKKRFAKQRPLRQGGRFVGNNVINSPCGVH
jgi:hypothetical protein